MANSPYIRVTNTKVGDENGYDIVAGDSYEEAAPFFITDQDLHGTLGKGVAEKHRVILAITCLQQGGDCADIIQAAIDNGEIIDTLWGPVDGNQIDQYLKQRDSAQQTAQFEQDTMAVSDKGGKAPRL